MMPIITLLKRDLLDFKKNIFSIFTFWVLAPVFLHLFLSIPLSNIITIDIRYLSWASPGVWITTSCMAAFLQSANRMRKLQFTTGQMEAILKAPISNLDLLLSIIIRGVFYGIFQFIISILITSLLNNEYLAFYVLFIIIIQMLFLIFHFAVLGALIGGVVENDNLYYNIVCLLFLSLTIGLGNFIPLSYYPKSFLSIITFIPTVFSFENLRSIILHNPFNWLSFFLTLFLTFILSIFNLIISYKIFRKI